MTSPLTQSRLKELLEYSGNDGHFRWRARRGNVAAGSIAGCKHGAGYLKIGIDGRLYLAHRLAWLFVYGRWPEDQIDHINGNKSDNRITNLREASTAENHQNMPTPSNNRSGHIGVHWDRFTGRWMAQIRVAGKTKTLGRFDTVAEAAGAYRQAKAKLHGFQPQVRDHHQTHGLRAVALLFREVPP